MRCLEFVEFLMAYLERELPTAEREEFERHLDRCPDCVNYLATYEETVRLGKGLCDDPDGPPPADAPDELVRAILAARAKAN
jgi:anti-sigma factor RsiW